MTADGRATWKPYGDATMIHGTTGETIRLVRRGQKCRWLDEEGGIVSEQKNVAPAIAWAFATGYFDPVMTRAGISVRYEQYAPGKYREVSA